MTGPAWLAAGFAGLMLLVAACCAARLVLWRLRGRDTELDADAAHVLMGVAMAGMFETRLRLLPGAVWLGVFAMAGVWFTGQALRTSGRRRAGGLRCPRPAPHAAESAVMLFMLGPGSPANHGAAAAMPGMNEAGASALGNPALAVVLAVFMLGWVVSAIGSGADVSGSAMAPRLAAGYKIAMGIGMGYMLVAMI